jgi:hypothetical protein
MKRNVTSLSIKTHRTFREALGIADTILGKIRLADVFLADLTFMQKDAENIDTRLSHAVDQRPESINFAPGSS